MGEGLSSLKALVIFEHIDDNLMEVHIFIPLLPSQLNEVDDDVEIRGIC